MKHCTPCTDIYLLTTIACQLSKCLSEEELTLLSIDLVTLGDLISSNIARRTFCDANKTNNCQKTDLAE